MRVIGGSAGGRKLSTPHDRAIRPTADRVKEALFSILGSHCGDFHGLRVLDIFAGTGNLGIEALSRGAAEAVFVDSSREAVRIITNNLSLLGFGACGRVLQKEALAALKALEAAGERFDLVFLDPPYTRGLTEQVLSRLAVSSVIGDASLVVAESAARENLPQEFDHLCTFDRRVYGDTALWFLRLKSKG